MRIIFLNILKILKVSHSERNFTHSGHQKFLLKPAIEIHMVGLLINIEIRRLFLAWLLYDFYELYPLSARPA
jgi:hypothetical protein